METVQLSKSDILEIMNLINQKRQEQLDSSFDDIEWEYYFLLNEIEQKLIQ